MATTVDLGGPGAPCSKSKVRRLLAGELSPEERARVSAHLLGCERCRAEGRELAAEREALVSALPFEQFASGVAERLARTQPARPRFWRWAPLLAAASVLIVAVPLALRERTSEEQYDGIKGSGPVQLYVKDARGVHAWQPGEGIPESADVHAELRAGPHDRFAAALLVEGGQAHALYSGLAHTEGGKPRVVSFGWTGNHDAQLYVSLSREPIEVQKLQAPSGERERTGGPRVFAIKLTRAP